MNPLYTSAEIEHGLGEVDAEVAVVLTPFYEKVAALESTKSLRRIIATNIKEYLPPLLKLLFTVVKERREGHRVSIRDEDRRLRDLLQRHSEDSPPTDIEVTAEVLVDGWLRTGDLAHMDEDGYVYISDRAKDLIKTSGFQVWPREVEEAIAALSGVAEISVAGVPDPQQGESVHAWIVLQPDATLEPEQVRDHCRETLAAYKVPRQVTFRESLPKSTVGKVLRRLLVEETVAAARTDRSGPG